MAGFDIGGLPRDQGKYGVSFRYNADDEWEEIGPLRPIVASDDGDGIGLGLLRELYRCKLAG